MTPMGPAFEPRAPASPRRPARRWQGLEDRPSMPIYWGFNIHPGANTSSSARNCRLTSAVYVSVSGPGAAPADFGKLLENQRLGVKRKGHGDVTRRDLGLSSFRP